MGGKSWALLFEALKYRKDPEFYGVYIRKSLKQLERTLWKEALKLWKPFLYHLSGDKAGELKEGAKIYGKPNYKIIFPKDPVTGLQGATFEFTYADSIKTVEENFQGAELSAVFLDELTHFDEEILLYLRTRLRSSSDTPSFMRCSLNPAVDHWVLKWLSPWILDSGYADRDISGKIRYFIMYEGELFTDWDYDVLKEKFPSLTPRPYTFVVSSLKDNPEMLKKNALYAEELQANNKQNAEMLLHGNWLYRPSSNGVFDRNSLIKIDKRPLNTTRVRAWDKASTEPNPEGTSHQKNPDYTASVKLEKDSEGNIYLVGDYYRDNEGKQVGRFRKKTGERNRMILKQCQHDGEDVTVILPKDPAQAGDFEFSEHSKALIEEGFIVKKDPSVSNKSKLIRFEPFVAACEAGFVYVVESTFDRTLLDALYNELENFDGDKNNGYHDDWVDAISSAFCYLSGKRTVTAPSLPSLPSIGTKMSELRVKIGR